MASIFSFSDMGVEQSGFQLFMTQKLLELENTAYRF